MKKHLVYIFVLVNSSLFGCSHFAETDRSQVNRPSMKLGVPFTAANQSTLTQQKSSSSVSIGSCSVCAH